MQSLSSTERILMGSSLLIGFVWIAYRIFTNTGWVLDDEISHYIFSSSVWENPAQIFNHWTRPGRNFIHLWVAPLGITATRFFTLCLALLSVWVTFKIAEILNIKLIWSVPILLMFQSWFPELSYPVLTQTPFMLIWILAVWLALKKQWHCAGFCFGYLSLIRHEGIVLTAAWGFLVTFSAGGFGRYCLLGLKNKSTLKQLWKSLSRDTCYGMTTISSILIYNLVAFVLGYGLPFSLYFETNPTQMYGHGSIFHYVPLLIMGVGPISFLLALYGIYKLPKNKSEWSILLVMYPLYFVLHSLIYWRGAFASGGYYHFLMPMAPFFALLAALGISEIWSKGKIYWRKVSAFGLLLIVFLQGMNMPHHQLNYQNWFAIHAGDANFHYRFFANSIRKSELNEAMVIASQWATENYSEGTPIIAKNASHNFTQNIRATKKRQELENLPLFKMPLGTVFIWDALYCDYENRLKFESFSQSKDWKIVKKWKLHYPISGRSTRDKFSVIIFEKVAMGDQSDKEYSELGEADKYNEAYQ